MRTVCALPAGVSWQSQMQEQIGEAPVSCVCSYSHKTPNRERAELSPRCQQTLCAAFLLAFQTNFQTDLFLEWPMIISGRLSLGYPALCLISNVQVCSPSRSPIHQPVGLPFCAGQLCSVSTHLN